MSPARPAVTVLTPTYNRAHTLGRLHESLLEQTFRNFEWIVVDDGSDDETMRLVDSWVQDAGFDVRYTRQANLGQFAAVNRGLELARGALTTIVDSDDWVPQDGLATLVRHWSDLPKGDRLGFSGVVGLCAYEDGRLVGDPFPADPLDCDPIELVYTHRVTGDKHSLLRTEVLREFPFPSDSAHAYISPQLVWNRMALKYRERHFNEVVKIVEYQPGGLSDRSLELSIRSPSHIRQFFLEEAMLPRPIGVRRRLRSHANYVRFSFHAGTGLRNQITDAPSKLVWMAVLPLGFGLYLRDRRRFPEGPSATA